MFTNQCDSTHWIWTNRPRQLSSSSSCFQVTKVIINLSKMDQFFTYVLIKNWKSTLSYGPVEKMLIGGSKTGGWLLALPSLCLGEITLSWEHYSCVPAEQLGLAELLRGHLPGGTHQLNVWSFGAQAHRVLGRGGVIRMHLQAFALVQVTLKQHMDITTYLFSSNYVIFSEHEQDLYRRRRSSLSTKHIKFWAYPRVTEWMFTHCEKKKNLRYFKFRAIWRI